MKRHKSQFMETYISELWVALKAIATLLKSNGIRFTIIGGAARNQYGYSKITEDVDLLIDRDDKEKMLNLPIGFIRELSHKRGKVFSFHNPKTKVEVIYTGEISGDGVNGLKYVDPAKVSNNIKGIPFLALKYLIMYKLSSGIYGKARFKDFDDVYELIRINKLPENYAKDFRKDLYNKYIELWSLVNEN